MLKIYRVSDGEQVGCVFDVVDEFHALQLVTDYSSIHGACRGTLEM